MAGLRQALSISFALASIGVVFAEDGTQEKTVPIVGKCTLVDLHENGQKWTGTAWHSVLVRGRVWEFYSDGTGDFGGSPAKWSYDSKKRKIKAEAPLIPAFSAGWVYLVEDGDVVIDANILTISHKVNNDFQKWTLRRVLPETVSLDTKTFDRDFFTETHETQSGIPKEIVLKRDFETSVTATGTIGVEVSTEAKLGNDKVGSISAGAKAKIEASLGISIGTRDTFEERYHLDGKDHTKVTIKWVKRYRKGIINLPDGSKQKFEAFVGCRTIPEYPKD